MGWIIFILATIGWHIGLYGMFKKAGIEPWKALIPFYNTWCIVQKSHIKKYWFWLQLIPIAGQFITMWIIIIFVMNFGQLTVLQHAGAVFVPFAYLPYVGYSKDIRWIGPEKVRLYKKSAVREWVDAAVFAVVAATLIRTFIFEAYTIPTESMEKTLLVNDFLFVNKMSYGARLPSTPLSFPFVHNTMPGSVTTPSYLKWIQIPYTRVKGLDTIKRNDVVVFNVPEGDTIINLSDYGSKVLYYDVLRDQYNGNRDALMAEYPILVHPFDKTDNYIKRCVGIPGDVIQLIHGKLFVNNKPAYVSPSSQIDYLVETDSIGLDAAFIQDQLGIDLNDTKGQYNYIPPNKKNSYTINLTPELAELTKKNPHVKNVSVAELNFTGQTFPFDNANYLWTPDNFEPLYIPRKNATVQLSSKNISIYRRLITTYEHNTLVENGDSFTINGKVTNSYTFKYNYYWMMGDNRHRSQDARYWGFVPETNVVGKASLIWFSYDTGPRWNRIFKSIR